MSSDKCEHLTTHSVLFPSYEDEHCYFCNKHNMYLYDDEPPEYALPCHKCKGEWSREQIENFIFGEDDE